MQRASVGKKNLGASRLRSNTVTVEERHRSRGLVRLPVALEDDVSLDERYVRGCRIGCRVLRHCRGRHANQRRTRERDDQADWRDR
jgi:hypothetical protein